MACQQDGVTMDLDFFSHSVIHSSVGHMTKWSVHNLGGYINSRSLLALLLSPSHLISNYLLLICYILSLSLGSYNAATSV